MAPQPAPDWKAALLAVRTQIADYEREGTSTPGKLKRTARLRSARRALMALDAVQPAATVALRQLLSRIEAAEKDDNWRRITELVQQTLRELDGWVGTTA